jgi:hypothetical protein
MGARQGETPIDGALRVPLFIRRLSVALFGLFLAGCGSTPSAVSPMPTQQATLVPSPSTGEATGVGVTRWREVGSFGGSDSTEHVLGVTFGAGQFVAVGVHYAVGHLPDVGPVPHEGGVWLSPDGASWEALPTQPTLRARLSPVSSAPEMDRSSPLGDLTATRTHRCKHPASRQLGARWMDAPGSASTWAFRLVFS